MIYLHYKDTKTFGHSFSFLLIFNALSANYLQVGNFSYFIMLFSHMRYVRRVNLATVSQCHIRLITLFQPSGT